MKANVIKELSKQQNQMEGKREKMAKIRCDRETENIIRIVEKKLKKQINNLKLITAKLNNILCYSSFRINAKIEENKRDR